MDFDKWITHGKQLGLEGAKLRQWYKEQQEQALAREERALARWEKEKEREREEREKERGEREKEREAAREAGERDV